ncbi:MAG: hypothetical protein WC378_10785, partial [Opitutaceae bacterium]
NFPADSGFRLLASGLFGCGSAALCLFVAIACGIKVDASTAGFGSAVQAKFAHESPDALETDWTYFV